MELIQVNERNIDSEHICCAITEKKGDPQVASKKQWMKERFEDGLVFLKLNVRGKAFIEYLPAEKAWSPVDADGWMFINCFWISGQFKGKGYSNLLLEECVRDAKEKGKKGLVILSAGKKMPFLSDPKFLAHKGFVKVDEAEPYFHLMCLPFEEGLALPTFRPQAKNGVIDDEGLILYYTNQCPFNAKYIPLLEAAAEKKGAAFRTVKIESLEDAKNSPAPSTSYSLYHKGRYVTNECFSEKKFEKYLDEHC